MGFVLVGVEGAASVLPFFFLELFESGGGMFETWEVVISNYCWSSEALIDCESRQNGG